VHNFGARWHGSLAGKLPAGVTPTGIAADPATGGYWVLKSDGGVSNFNAPWYGSLARQLPPEQAVKAIAGQ
jgi:DNA-binding beta-propeller fold protein YncE